MAVGGGGARRDRGGGGQAEGAHRRLWPALALGFFPFVLHLPLRFMPHATPGSSPPMAELAFTFPSETTLLISCPFAFGSMRARSVRDEADVLCPRRDIVPRPVIARRSLRRRRR